MLRPLALVLEDLHWADATTLDLVEHLISHGLRFPLVGTWRLDDLDTPTAARDWSTRVQRSASVQTLELGPLTQEESGEQLRILLGESAAPRDLVATIHGRTLGQPLFTEQLAAHGSGGDDQLPRLLGDLLDRRIEGLSPSAWQVARCLGVADRPLPHSLVEQASRTSGDGRDRRPAAAGGGTAPQTGRRRPRAASTPAACRGRPQTAGPRRESGSAPVLGGRTDRTSRSPRRRGRHTLATR